MTSTTARARSREQGFSLTEMMAVIALFGILLALGFPAIRTYWMRQSLAGATDELVTEMRSLQSRVTAESHPLVYGMRFTTQGGWLTAGRWGLVKYDPTGGVSGTPKCTQYGTGDFGGGAFGVPVQIVNPSFVSGSGTSEQSFCRTNLVSSTGASLSAGSDQFVFFYARGTATGGTAVLRQPNLPSGGDVTIRVHPLTGRVEEQ